MSMASAKWRNVTLDNIAIQEKGAIRRGPFGGSLKKEIFVPEGFKVYEQKNVIYNDFARGDYFITRSKFDELSGFAVLPGDILISCAGTLGRIAIVPDNAEPGIINQALMRIRPNNEIICTAYLRWFLESPKIQREFFESSSGSAIKNVRAVSELKSTEFLLPPLSEQERIAGILDKADDIRRKRQTSILDVQQLKESGFLNLFGDPRKANNEWETVRLGDVSKLDAPMVDPREEKYADMIHIGPDRIEKETGRLLPALTAREENLISKKFLFDERYLLYSKIRPYLRKVALPNFSGLCSADMYPVRPVENVTTREYLYSLLISEAFLSYTESLSTRANIPKLNRKELASYEFPLPPFELQLKYAKFMQAQAKLNQRYATVVQESEDLFNSLVQRAFKGEL